MGFKPNEVCRIKNEYPQIESLETQTRKQRRPVRTGINKNNLIELTFIGMSCITQTKLENKEEEWQLCSNVATNLNILLAHHTTALNMSWFN